MVVWNVYTGQYGTAQMLYTAMSTLLLSIEGTFR